MKGSLLLSNLKLNNLIFYRSKQLTDYIYTDIWLTVNCRNALDGLRIHMNIILCYLVVELAQK